MNGNAFAAEVRSEERAHPRRGQEEHGRVREVSGASQGVVAREQPNVPHEPLNRVATRLQARSPVGSSGSLARRCEASDTVSERPLRAREAETEPPIGSLAWPRNRVASGIVAARPLQPRFVRARPPVPSM